MNDPMETYYALMLFLGIVGIVYFWLEDHRDRIRELSHTLQLIELHTGIPYYSSLRPSNLGIEDRDWLNRAKARLATPQ